MCYVVGLASGKVRCFVFALISLSEGLGSLFFAASLLPSKMKFGTESTFFLFILVFHYAVAGGLAPHVAI